MKVISITYAFLLLNASLLSMQENDRHDELTRSGSVPAIDVSKVESQKGSSISRSNIGTLKLRATAECDSCHVVPCAMALESCLSLKEATQSGVPKEIIIDTIGIRISHDCLKRVAQFLWRADSIMINAKEDFRATDIIHQLEHEKESVIAPLQSKAKQDPCKNEQLQNELAPNKLLPSFLDPQSEGAAKANLTVYSAEQENFEHRMELLDAAYKLQCDLLQIALVRVLIKHLKYGEQTHLTPSCSPSVTPSGSPRSDESTPRSHDSSPRSEDSSPRSDTEAPASPPQIRHARKSSADLRPKLLRRQSGGGSTNMLVTKTVGDKINQRNLWNRITKALPDPTTQIPLLDQIARYYVFYYKEPCAAADHIPYTFSFKELRSWGMLNSKNHRKNDVLDYSGQRLYKISGIMGLKTINKVKKLLLKNNRITEIKPAVITSLANSHLTEIDLSGNPLTPQTKAALQDCVAHGKRVTYDA